MQRVRSPNPYEQVKYTPKQPQTTAPLRFSNDAGLFKFPQAGNITVAAINAKHAEKNRSVSYRTPRVEYAGKNPV